MSQASEYGRNVSDLYSQQGQAYANAAANKAAIWGGTVAKLGDFAANTVQVYSAQKQDKRLKDLFEKASTEFQAQSQLAPEGFTGPENTRPRQSPIPTVGELVNVVGPERAIKIADGLKGLQAIASPQVPFEKKMSGLRDTMLGLNALSPEMRKEFYPHARQVVLGAGLGINPADVPEQFDENWFQSIVNYGKEPDKGKSADAFTLGEGQTRFGPNGEVIAAVPKTAAEKADAAFTLSPGQVRFGPNGERLADVPAAEGAQGGFTLSPGETRYDASGKPIAARAPKPEKPEGSKEASQAEITAAGYANRMEDAEKVLTDVEPSIANMRVLSYAAQSRMPPAAQSKDFQRYDQAGRNFINAVLRRESGAAVSQSEFDNARRQYLPQPGDDPETLKQKAQNRKRAFDTLKQAGGSAYQSSAPATSTGPKEGDTKPIPGYPGTEQTYRHGKWIRTK